MLPDSFISLIRTQLGSETEAFLKALEEEPQVSIRTNTKTAIDTCALTPVPWHPHGYYLNNRPSFTLDPLFHAGCYYVQEASSMFLYQVLQQYVKKDSVILDLCAAPGGKSTLISEYIGEEGLLVSNEVVRQRAFVLSENIQKWGNGNTVVTYNQPKDIAERLPCSFDCVLVDAPCSGEGMFRKDPQSIEEWSEQNVKMCAERQRDILRCAWKTLRCGGVLVYSTCTYNACEDEENAQWIIRELGAELLPVAYEKAWGIKETTGCHFYPHRTRGEGFYIVAFRKNSSETAKSPFVGKKDKERKPKEPTAFRKQAAEWLIAPERWSIVEDDRFLQAYPLRYEQQVQILHKLLICISAGFGVGEVRGRNLFPQHSLAMAKHFQKDALPSADLSLQQALSYLRCESLSIPDIPTGAVCMTYHGVPLGFVKNIGSHCNNLYPKEWRIRKQIDC